MPLVLANRVRETTTTTGTGTISLAGPVSGFQGFSTAIGNANTTYYTIVDAATGAWEVGLGTYTSSGSTLARTTVLSSSNAGAAVNFAAGTKDVFVTQPAERAVYVLGAGTGLAAGAAAFTANGVPYASATNTLTTGSALTFDGTNLGVGSNAPGQKFVVNGASGVAIQLENSSDSNRGGRFVASGSAASGTFAVNTTSSGYALTFGIDSNEQMRLTSTGLGIGNSSPTAKLDVTGTAAISGAVTLSGGTANGVAFLNGSKVLTTGSALTFDGTGQLVVNRTGGSAGLILQSNDASTSYLFFGDQTSASVGRIEYDHGTNGMPFYVNGSETMRLTSTGLGIGNSSPTAKLDVTGTAAISGAVTLSGGTANGVAFLNGSKVLTTGSALTFDGNNLTIGANGQVGSRLSVIANGAMASFNTGAAADGRIEYAYNGTNIFYTGVNSSSLMMLMARSGVELGFGANNTEQMRLTSTGLGIGTSSPAYKVDAVGSIQSQGTHGAGSFNAFIIKNTLNSAGSGKISWQGSSSNETWAIAQDQAVGAGYLEFNYLGSNKAVLDSSGNLGLGVTPSAWGSAFRSLDMRTNGAGFAASDDAAIVSANAYNNSGWKFKGTSIYRSSRYDQFDGTHAWHIGNTGTAGNAITFTQAMTLDASGNLLVGGTSSLGYRSQIFSATNGYTQALVQTSAFSSGNLSGTVYAGYYDGSSITDMASIRGGKENTTSGNYGGMLAFYTRPNGGSDTERARITSGGEVYIAGTTDQGAYNLQVNGTGVWGAGAYVNGSDRNLKNNIQSLDLCLDVVMAMRPVTFQYKPEHSKDQSVQPGFIAQELQEAMAGKTYIDGVIQAGPKYLNVAYQNIIPILVKSIQELKAEFDAYKATHP